MYQERLAGRTTEAIVLWKSATETAAWKTLTKLSCRVCFPLARIRFAGPAGEERTGPKFSPELFYVGGRPERFETTFDGISAIITGADVAKNDFSLNPSRYVAQNGKDETLPLGDAVVLLKEEEEERREADEQLKKVLGGLGLDLDR